MNDSISLAKRLGADGVHLGQDDGDPREAREEIVRAWLLLATALLQRGRRGRGGDRGGRGGFRDRRAYGSCSSWRFGAGST